jgi:hypothetical protein
VIALAGDLDLAGSRFFAGLSAKLLAGLRETPARKVGTFHLFNRSHRLSYSPFSVLRRGTSGNSFGAEVNLPTVRRKRECRLNPSQDEQDQHYD